jgi:dipeptidyl-peptidase 4
MRLNLPLSFAAAIFYFVHTGLFAQVITLEEAVLPHLHGLTPTQPEALQWVKGADRYSLLENNALVVKEPSGKVVAAITLDEVNRELPNGPLKGWPRIEWTGPNRFVFESDRAYFSFDLNEKSSRLLTKMSGNGGNAEFHAASGGLAYTIENNVLLAQSTKAVNITKTDNPEIVSGQSIARNEFGISKGLFWSDDGKKLAFYQKDETNVSPHPMIDYAAMPATGRSIKYPMAGQGSEIAAVGIYNLSNGELTYLQAFTEAGPDHYLTNLAFTPDGKAVLLAVVNREQKKMWLNRYNAENGFLEKTLFTEENPRYVEPENPALFIPSGNGEFLWFSERDGYNHLYRYSSEGKLLNQVTSGEFPVTNFLGFDPAGRYCFVQATGGNATERHLFRVEIASDKMQRLTSEPGTHSGRLSSSGRMLLVHSTSSKNPGTHRIITDSGKPAAVIHTSDNPLKERTIGQTEVFTISPGGGRPDLWCRLIKPSHFDPKKKYPVLVYVYSGPHVQLITDSWLSGAPLWMQSLAEEGYMVFTLDGRGSLNRGFEFESCIHRQMGRLETEDQLAGVDWLRKQPWVDASRMAIHGWSCGGFMTTTLMLRHPGVFKAGVAGGPVMDWKFYEVMYTERYMDTPETNADGFAESAPMRHVDNLAGKLLIIHGTDDDVVVMQHSMAFLKECIARGKQPDFFVYPGHAHNVRGKDRVHLMEKVLAYVKESLKD